MSSLKDKTSEICSNTSRSKLEKDILKSYLDEQIKLLLDRINLLYPKQFKKRDLKGEWKSYQKWKPNIKLTEPINNGINKNNTKSSKTSINKDKKNNIDKQNVKSNIPLQEERCIARVFDVNKIIYQQDNEKNKSKIKGKTSSSKTINNNLLKTIESNSKSITFGRQCYGKKCSDSNYCFVHKRNNPHGDFNNPITPHLKEHFIKMYKTFN